MRDLPIRDPLAGEVPEGGAVVHVAGGVVSWRLDLAQAALGKGTMCSQFSDDTVINLADCCFDTTCHREMEITDDVLLVRGALSASSEYQFADRPSWHFRRPAVTVSVLPRGTRLATQIEAGVAVKAVTVLLSPRALIERHGVALADLPAPLAALIEGRLEAPQTLVSLPIDADIAALVRDLLSSRLEGSLRRMQLQGRAAELLALVAAGWRAQLAAGQWPGARRRDAELLAAARRILLERFADPPTMAELASHLGTNKNKLNQLFQSQLKVTPQGFCLKLRIERAQALIAEGRLSLGQVAEAVGYEHQSSFAAAFRDAVGVPPRQYAESYRRESTAATMH